MIKPEVLKKLIVGARLMTKEALNDAEKKAKTKRVNLEQYLLEEHLLPENLLYETIANSSQVPFLDLRKYAIRQDVLNLVPEPIVQVHQVAVFDRTPDRVKVATLDPKDLQTFEFIKKKTGLPVEVYVTTPSSIREVIAQYHKGLSAEIQAISGVAPEGTPVSDERLKELAEDLPVIRIVDTLLEYAIFEGASDIHIEPEEQDVLVRYRIDGKLRDVMRLPKSAQAGVIARVKILASLKIDEHRLPQDGRFKLSTPEYKVAFRVSLLPVFDGEKGVLRILNESAQVLTLEQLGLQPQALTLLKRCFEKPHGIIYVTGPTGSGKTTTLYTILNILNVPDVNITTIEDPIEYRMPRVNQSQVNPKIGWTFATGLRTLLRQDPDIVMVGEIRDNETAEIAAHAAMTGHLVLSTLHTNDAVTALPRLMEMNVPTFLIASTTNLIMAQRLVRKICVNCIKSYTLTKKAIEDLRKQFDLEQVLGALEKQGVILSAKAPPESLLFYRGVGCKQCSSSGYRGRIGIYEAFEVTPEIAELILGRAPTEQLLRAVRKQGMVTMLQDGFIKAKNGITTVEEVLRVTRE